MASEAPSNCSIVVESKSSAVTDVCKQILSKLEENNFDNDDIFAVHLTLEEAFLNAVKHGNKMDPTKKVKIDYCVDPDKVEISITDEGSGFEPESVDDPRFGKGLYEPGRAAAAAAMPRTHRLPRIAGHVATRWGYVVRR